MARPRPARASSPSTRPPARAAAPAPRDNLDELERPAEDRRAARSRCSRHGRSSDTASRSALIGASPAGGASARIRARPRRARPASGAPPRTLAQAAAAVDDRALEPATGRGRRVDLGAGHRGHARAQPAERCWRAARGSGFCWMSARSDGTAADDRDGERPRRRSADAVRHHGCQHALSGRFRGVGARCRRARHGADVDALDTAAAKEWPRGCNQYRVLRRRSTTRSRTSSRRLRGRPADERDPVHRAPPQRRNPPRECRTANHPASTARHRPPEARGAARRDPTRAALTRRRRRRRRVGRSGRGRGSDEAKEAGGDASDVHERRVRRPGFDFAPPSSAAPSVRRLVPTSRGRQAIAHKDPRI